MKIVFDSPFNLGIFNNGDWLFEKYKYRCEKYDWWWNYFLVKDGKLILENFAKVSLPIANFYTKHRLKRIFKLKDIEETKWKAYNYTKEWWKLFKAILISEGKILKENLEHIGKNSEWIEGKLAEYNVLNMDEIFWWNI